MPRDSLGLETLGWNSEWEERFAHFRDEGLRPARVAIEDKHRYVVLGPDGELSGQVSGKFLHQTSSASELPKVGDWVAISPIPDEAKAIIHHVLPRRTKLSRKVPGPETEEQVLVTNVDIAFVVHALDRTFRPGLLQRHLVTVLEGGAKPVVVLNKADLCENILGKIADAEKIAGEAPVLAVSAKTGQAMESLAQLIRPGETVVFIGSSGVGKSSLINQLYGDEIQATTEVRESDSKGRHTTTWRELILLPRGGLVIDTPGMREFQMWMAGEGIHDAFSDIEALSVQCHFRDCSHTVEKRCAVLEAVAAGTLPRERYDSYLKLRREVQFLEQAQHKYAQLQRKRRSKMAQRAFNKIKRDADWE